MSKFVHARDTISGKVAEVPEIYLSLPGLKEHLVLVADDAKDAAPELYKPTDAKGFEERKAPAKPKAEDKPTLDSEIK